MPACSNRAPSDTKRLPNWHSSQKFWGQQASMGFSCFALKATELSLVPFPLNAQTHEPFL